MSTFEGSKPTRRRFLQSLGLAAGAAVLPSGLVAGCATSGSKSSGGDVDDKNINFYGNSLGEAANKKLYEDGLAAFEKASGASVKPVTYPFDQASTQLLLLARSGTAHGAAQAGPWQPLMPLGVLADLSDLAEKYSFPANALEPSTVDGKLYALPQFIDGIGLVANRDMLDAVGYTTDPMTINDFVSKLEALQKLDKKVIPYAASTKQTLKDIIPWMQTFGSPVISQELDCTLGDKASVDAVKWYKSLMDQKLIAANTSRVDSRVLYGRKQTAMYDDASLAHSFLASAGASGAELKKLTPLPRPTLKLGDQAHNILQVSGNMVFKGRGENTARALAEYFATDVSFQTAQFDQNRRVGAVAEVTAQIPGVKTDEFQQGWQKNVITHAQVPAYNRVPTADAVESAIEDATAKILAGRPAGRAGGAERGPHGRSRGPQEMMCRRR